MKRFALFLLLILPACATYSASQEMAIVCRSFESTLRIVTPFKPSMSAAQIKTVDDAVSVLEPSCKAASRGEAPALNTMRIALRALLTVEKEAKP